MQSYIQLVVAFALSGILSTLLIRYGQRKQKGWKSTLKVLYGDFTFEEYATLNLLSFVYAIAVGGLTGAGIAYMILAIFNQYDQSIYLLTSIICFLLIPITRVTVEGYTVIYKTAKDASSYFTFTYKNRRTMSAGEQDDTENTKGIRQESKLYGYGNQQEMFSAILKELQEAGISIENVSYNNSGFGKNKIIICDNSRKRVAVYTLNTDGTWNIEIL